MDLFPDFTRIKKNVRNMRLMNYCFLGAPIVLSQLGF